VRVVAYQRIDERIDRVIARPLHPLRKIRIFVERNRVHFRVQSADQPRER
jgi:hypothetical protein